MKDEAKANEETVKQEKEKVEKINNADALIFQTEKQLKEYGDKLPADKKGEIEKALEELKTAHKSQDLGAIDVATNALNTVWQAASEELYKTTQEQGGPQADPGQDTADQGSAPDDEVTDVDFEEVKDDK